MHVLAATVHRRASFAHAVAQVAQPRLTRCGAWDLRPQGANHRTVQRAGRALGVCTELDLRLARKARRSDLLGSWSGSAGSARARCVGRARYGTATACRSCSTTSTVSRTTTGWRICGSSAPTAPRRSRRTAAATCRASASVHAAEPRLRRGTYGIGTARMSVRRSRRTVTGCEASHSRTAARWSVLHTRSCWRTCAR